jgi:Ser/Thr protein kinase RdoA (MazF antagonist)
MVSVMAGHLDSGAIPTRVVHGDTKLNNILFDQATGKARSIIDLDTCMAGYSLYDFGDLVRFTAATSAEDEPDLTQVGTDLELYRALAEGYLSTAGAFLLPVEVELMPFAARLVTFTIGLRFLADHLAGDVYFKIDRPGHNLDRALVQFEMVRFMEHHETNMKVF